MKKDNMAVPQKMKPTLYLDDKELPDVSDIEMGSECVLEIKGKVISKSLNEYDGEKTTNASIEITDIKVLKKNGETKDFKKFEKEFNRRK